MSNEKKATVALNGYLPASEVVAYMIRKFSDKGYTEGTFRNDIAAKKIIKVDKKVSFGKVKRQYFTEKTKEDYARARAEMYAKSTKGPVKKLKSPDLTEFVLPIYKSKLEQLRKVFTDEEIKNKLTSVLDEIHQKVSIKMHEIRQREAELMAEIKQSIQL